VSAARMAVQILTWPMIVMRVFARQQGPLEVVHTLFACDISNSAQGSRVIAGADALAESPAGSQSRSFAGMDQSVYKSRCPLISCQMTVR
jgi:hypothetical protein